VAVAHDIFICHSSEDGVLAHELATGLEQSGITCWIAPRDVMPGADYAQAIVAGISGARALVLVFSSHSNASPHVSREVERAVSHGVDIIPYRVEAVVPSRSLEYFISGAEWVDGTSGTVADHVRELTTTVRATVFGEVGRSPRQEAQETLRRMIDRYGTGLVDDPRRSQALLRDMAGEHRAEVAALVAAAEEGVGAALLQTSGGLTPEAAERLTQRLQENRALTADASAWAVSAWLYALGVEGPSEAEMTVTAGRGPATAAAHPASPPEPEATGAPPPPPIPPPSTPSPDELAATVPAEGGPQQPRVEPAMPPHEPPRPPPHPPPPPPDDGRRKRIAAFIGGGVIAIAAIGGAIALTGGGGDVVLGPSEVFLEPVAEEGPDPFTPSVAVGTAGLVRTLLTLPTTTIPPDETTTTLPLGAIRAVSGGAVGLYGGTRELSQCDARQMIDFLDENADKAAAWAAVQGIATEFLSSYIADLTPVILTGDTRVTNHGFRDGRATPRQSVLQAGTAVLVDDFGVPRARCACGNPLVEPRAIAAPSFVGDAWESFDPVAVQVIQGTDPVDEFVLVDLESGETFVRASGLDVSRDTRQAATTTTTTLPATTTTTLTSSVSLPPGVVLGSGDVQVTLAWNSLADLDVGVYDPWGEYVSYEFPSSSSGGQLDVDANYPCETASTPAVENIFWPSGLAPPGTYRVTVGFGADCDVAATDYELIVQVAGEIVERRSGTLTRSDEVELSFEVVPLGQAMDVTALGTVLASSVFSSNFEAFLSVDGDPTTSWFSAGSDVDGPVSTYVWQAGGDEFITSVQVISNARHQVPEFRTGFGFTSVTVQVLDLFGDVVFEQRVSLDGTPDPDVTVEPNVLGSSVLLLLEGHEDRTCGGFGELVVTALR
jgi:hypothetical protein